MHMIWSLANPLPYLKLGIFWVLTLLLASINLLTVKASRHFLLTIIRTPMYLLIRHLGGMAVSETVSVIMASNWISCFSLLSKPEEMYFLTMGASSRPEYFHQDSVI